jgi:site-specific DNA-cytosine methylase
MLKTIASMFSGGGGWEVGAKAAGLRSLWGVEFVPQIADVHEANIGHRPIVMDATKLTRADAARRAGCKVQPFPTIRHAVMRQLREAVDALRAKWQKG